jgi:lysophospholipase L1-like esterase
MKNYILIFIFLISIQTFSQSEKVNKDWPNLNRFKMENATLPSPAKNEKRVVFMGNSITEGWQYIDTLFFKNKQFVNRGISGQTTPQMLLRFRQDVIRLNPYAVVILAGINDIAQNTGYIPVEDIFGNIQSMAELAKASGIKVILSSVLPANILPWNEEIKPADMVIQLNTMLEKYCKANNHTFLDYYSKLVDDKKGLGKEYSDDGVHPNLKGYQVMEMQLEKALNQVLK